MSTRTPQRILIAVLAITFAFPGGNVVDASPRGWAPHGYVSADTNSTEQAKCADSAETANTLFVEESSVSPRSLQSGRLYLCVLGYLGKYTTQQDRHVVLKRFAQMEPLLTDAEFQSIVVDGDRDEPEKWTFDERAAEVIAAWWRSKDVIPVTPGNERLMEHVGRIVKAEQAYATDQHIRGFDDRGMIYAKFGTPSKVDFVDWSLVQGISLIDDYPENEIWNYPRLSEQGSYLFVKDDGAFELGTSMDLIPTRLRSLAIRSGDRSNRRAFELLGLMEFVYERLAYYQDHMGMAYQSVWKYRSLIDENLAINDLGGSTYPIARTPAMVLSETMMDVRSIEAEFKTAREEKMPAESTGLVTVPHLAATSRLTRFLAEEGHTRAVIDWSVAPEALRSKRVRKSYPKRQLEMYDDRIVELTASVRDATYRDLDVSDAKLALYPGGRVPVGFAESVSVDMRVPVANIALQFNGHYAALTGNERVQYGPRVAYSVEWIKDVERLDASGTQLLMSDVRPLRLDAGAADEPITSSTLETLTTPIPAAELRLSDQLVLYFEAYNLRFDAADRTNYAVTYAVESTQGRFLGIGEKRSEISSSTVSYESQSSTAKEYILIDLSTLDLEAGDDITVTVKVMDEVTGERVSRKVPFELVE